MRTEFIGNSVAKTSSVAINPISEYIINDTKDNFFLSQGQVMFLRINVIISRVKKSTCSTQFP